MIGTILLASGMILIVVGFFFTMAGSRKLSDVSAEEWYQHQQYSNIPDHDDFFLNDRPDNVSTGHSNRSTVKGGGVIMIGPIPIIFGSDRNSSEIAIILAIILMLLWFVLFR
ncbi:TIGR00304 family membrane protein [Methanococcoides sp. FTZ1]|uniref:TIGR00304 family membrane protein n=1 Tax=Methanococcoides sp. FTZ1 TaxID=3439061 RepID=UPI003F852F85